jgi:DNA repair protein RadA/Sms
LLRVLHANNNNKDEEEEDDDDVPPHVDVANFRAPTSTYGLNRGRSSPLTRKALGGKQGNAGEVVSYICTNCGSEFVKSFGKCPTCREWNTLQPHTSTRRSSLTPPRPAFSSSSSWLGGGGNSRSSGSWVGQPYYSTSGGGGAAAFDNRPVRITDVDLAAPEGTRLVVPDDDEFNLVLGGGITKGSLTLLGGDPGVGKSTLLMQIACSLARSSKHHPNDNAVVWYVSGEETLHQIASRAERLRSRSSNLYLLQETNVDALCEQVIAFQNNNLHHHHHDPPAPRRPSRNEENDNDNDDEDNEPPQKQQLGLLIVDSIQTMHCDAAGGGMTGGVSQVRESVGLLLRLAKLSAIPILLIGHVTKSGDVAGPRTVEHMVDAVLYLEGQDNGGSSSNNNIRILRASKNRFGSTDEVGVYEMTAGRLTPVLDASALFLSSRNELDDEEGCAIAMYVF